MHGLPVSCPFNFPNGNLKQQLSHIGVFICYQNIDAKNKLNLHICGIYLLNPYKTEVSHLKSSFQMTVESNYVIGIATLSDWLDSRQFFNQSESKQKRIAPSTYV